MKYVKKTLVILIALLALSLAIALNAKLYSKPYIVEPETKQEIIIPEELQKIFNCESGNTHYEKDGVTVLRGKLNNDDLGIAQINLYHHQKQAEEMGLDLFKEEDSIKYALWLYEKEGNTPWNWSKPCWSK